MVLLQSVRNISMNTSRIFKIWSTIRKCSNKQRVKLNQYHIGHDWATCSDAQLESEFEGHREVLSALSLLLEEAVVVGIILVGVLIHLISPFLVGIAISREQMTSEPYRPIHQRKAEKSGFRSVCGSTSAELILPPHSVREVHSSAFPKFGITVPRAFWREFEGTDDVRTISTHTSPDSWEPHLSGHIWVDGAQSSSLQIYLGLCHARGGHQAVGAPLYRYFYTKVHV